MGEGGERIRAWSKQTMAGGCLKKEKTKAIIK